MLHPSPGLKREGCDDAYGHVDTWEGDRRQSDHLSCNLPMYHDCILTLLTLFLKMEAAYSSETLISIYMIAW
jgi:hypothetical protein